MPVVGAVADVAQVVVDRAVDVVVVAGPTLSPEALRRLSWALDRVGAQLVVVPGLVEVDRPADHVAPGGRAVAAGARGCGARAGGWSPKTVLDRVAGVVLLLAASPIIAVAALAVRLTSSGPAFYRQTRVGVDGAPFTMWKLRSMYVDADRRRRALDEQNDGNGVLFKMRDDPRVTPVGRFLRRYSLDELPQLFNVVRGDMSLVGPRPPLGEEVARYEDAAHRRLRVRPGLTGLWQVSGRSDLSWEESVRLDLRYVDNWSVAMDLMILWKTAPRRGAAGRARTEPRPMALDGPGPVGPGPRRGGAGSAAVDLEGGPSAKRVAGDGGDRRGGGLGDDGAVVERAGRCRRCCR